MVTGVWKALRTPTWLSRVVLLVGAVTVLSALSPALRERTALVTELVPEVFPAAATTGAAAVGVILIVLSLGLRRGKRRAWILAMVLSGAAVVLHLVKGLDVEEAGLCAVVLLLLATSGSQFQARPDPRSLARLLAVLVIGPVIAAASGWLWLTVGADGQLAGTTATARLTQAFFGLGGIPGPVRFVGSAEAVRSAVALAVLGAAVLVVALWVALAPPEGPHPLTPRESQRLRDLLARWGSRDSLSYFALRTDRSVMFSRSGKAAVTYRVLGSVSLAAGDPVGDPEAWPGAITAWLSEARCHGWVPAVLAASEAGAEAFHRAGLDALELGDEAVIDLVSYSLTGRNMRTVRQAVARCERAGLRVSCHLTKDLNDATRSELAAKAALWRGGGVERGFSMALGRFGSREDDGAVIVTARDALGQVRGLLHLVPWGEHGLSLDIMRRDPAAENGIIEQMVAGVAAYAPVLGVRRLSLNFAMFRSVFARGDRLGAGPVLRLWRSILLELSRFWQIESLYRANEKYRPQWTPRFVCFHSAADLPRVGVAALRAEAFLVAPEPLRRMLRQATPRLAPSTDPGLPELTAVGS